MAQNRVSVAVETKIWNRNDSVTIPYQNTTNKSFDIFIFKPWHNLAIKMPSRALHWKLGASRSAPTTPGHAKKNLLSCDEVFITSDETCSSFLPGSRDLKRFWISEFLKMPENSSHIAVFENAKQKKLNGIFQTLWQPGWNSPIFVQPGLVPHNSDTNPSSCVASRLQDGWHVVAHVHPVDLTVFLSSLGFLKLRSDCFLMIFFTAGNDLQEITAKKFWIISK